jgi:HAE1 family hydrophobic/amphiphilic exporter-1
MQQMRKIVLEHIKGPVLAVDGVTAAEVVGGQEQEIVVELNPRLLEHYNVSPYLVSQAVSNNIRNVIPGDVVFDSKKMFIRMGGYLNSVESILGIEINRYGANPVKISDLAAVGIKGKAVYSISRVNGKPQVTLSIERDRTSNAMQVSGAVQKKIDKVLKGIPYKLQYSIEVDEGESIRTEISDLLGRIGLIILIMIVLLIIMIRDIRSFFILLIAVALTEAATFNLLYFTNVSVNLLTLAALAIGIGIVIDNSIVILENIFQNLEKGLSLDDSVVKGTYEMIRPVLASTFTTIGVFFPFIFFSGRLRMYYMPLAIALVYSLLCSLVISFLFVPSAAKLLLKKGRKVRLRRKYFTFYKGFTRWSIRNSHFLIIIIIAIGFYSFKKFESVDKGRWFYSKMEDVISVGMMLPRGSEISRADEIVRKFEKIFVGKEGVKTVTTTIFSEYARLTVKFDDKAHSGSLPYELRQAANQEAVQHAGISIWINGFGDPLYTGGFGGFSIGGSYRIKLRGYNLDELKTFAADISKRITSHIRVKEVNIRTDDEMWFSGTIEELVFKLKKTKISADGLIPNEVAWNISSAIGQASFSGNMILNGNLFNINVTEQGAGGRQLDDLQMKIGTFSGGKMGRLGSYFDAEWENVPGSIRRENQQYQLTLSWEFRGPQKAGERYFKAIFKSISLPPGYTAEVSDWRYMTEEEKEELTKVIIASMIIIFIILAALYESFMQPFIIFFSIPFALIGVFLIFSWLDGVFDSSAYIGVVLLFGIVVNNAIILVDRYNVMLKKGIPFNDVLIDGTFSRTRPIILTTATTLAGLIPLIITAKAEGGDIWYNLALSTIGGLVSSALFTITLIPIIFKSAAALRKRLSAKTEMYKTIWKTGVKK